KDEAGSDLAKLGSGGEELGEEAAGRLIDFLWKERRAALAEELKAEDEARAFEAAGHVLRIKERRFGDAPEGERSLWISMHGGGGAPPELNDGQWSNQIRLYEPEEGIYVAPRAPTNTWNLWHQGHIDPLFDRMIASYVARHGVDPDRVYLMGYSAGGDGVYQLAPRMADRYAAAAMMAGHPNETRPDGLRNLPFMIFMGGKDGAYDRNKIAARWKETLEGLAEEDEGGYEHLVTIYPDKGHWMDREDRSALPWMAARRRDPWPSKVIWLQDDVRGRRFYWLELVEPGDGDDRARIAAEVKGQTVAIEAKGLDRIALRLRDNLIDLDKDIVVTFDGETVFSGRVPRTREIIEASLAGRADPRSACTAR
ncbi:MAG: dienelactone hydrolase family protein, partial [Planctomycetota bacterium]|nr:dienelactone hydrolase family protein [Planctomycetota bacterium]